MLALELMNIHGIGKLGYTFKFDRSLTRFGSCFWGRRNSNDEKYISLSKHLVLINDIEQVRDTILHEIAHALTPYEGHNKTWQRKAIEIGCNGKRCYNSYGSEEVNQPAELFKYIATCVNGHAHYRNKKPKQGRLQSCSICSKSFDTRYILRWEENNKQL